MWDILRLSFLHEVGLDDCLKSLLIRIFLWFCDWNVIKYFSITIKNIGTLDKTTEFLVYSIFFLWTDSGMLDCAV